MDLLSSFNNTHNYGYILQIRQYLHYYYSTHSAAGYFELYSYDDDFDLLTGQGVILLI